MKRHKPIQLLIVVCIMVGILTLTLWVSHEQPAYRGQPLAYWFNELPLTIVRANSIESAEQLDDGGRKYGSQRERPAVSLAAIQMMGADGLPFIMHKLARPEPTFTKWAQWLAYRCGIRHPLFANREAERAQAVTALLALSPLPPDAASQLQRLSRNNTNSVGLLATYLLTASTNPNFISPIRRFQ